MTNELRIKEGRTELTVNHLDTDLTFIHPVKGPNTYANVKQQIEADNFRVATMAETTSLVHAAFNSSDQYSEEIRQLMKDRWLWAFTGTLYTPKGVYIQDNPEIRDGMPFMDESTLVGKLEADSPEVRFVPYGFQTGGLTPQELARNEYIRALAGEDGAEKLAEVASKHVGKPYLWSFKSAEQPTTRISALGSCWGGGGLVVGGGGHGYGRGGYAFGVQE